MRVRALVVVATVLVACGGSKKPSTDPGQGSGSAPPDPGVVAQTLIGWGQQPIPDGKLNLFLEVSDHTGASKSYPIGAVVGPCAVAPPSGPDAVTVLRCVTAGVGSEYRAVYRGQIIVLMRAVDPSDDPADVELSFREVLRVDVPVGAKVGPAQ